MSDALLKIDAQGQLIRLGAVEKGKFISERSVDGCTNDAWNGTLTEKCLENYLMDDPSCIDTPGGDQSVTPLAAACMTGRLDIVQLLLHHRANPHALSPRKRTPLFYATSTRQEHDRLAIIRTLLEAGDNVDECYAESGFNTPLMNAVTLISDIDVVKELLKHGASPIATDVTGQTVEMLAKGIPIIEKILSRRVMEINKLLTSSGSSNLKVPNTCSPSTSTAEDGSGYEEQQIEIYCEDLLQRAAMFERAAKILRSQVPIGNQVWLKSIFEQRLGDDVVNFVADASHI